MGDATIVQRSRAAVRRGLLDGGVSIERTADALAVPPRTLQRRLADAGTTFSRVVDGVREELAWTYLHVDEPSIGEVGRRLGYATQAGFTRACRRWFDQTPTTVRANLRQPPARPRTDGVRVGAAGSS
jgi:AraC-like DNA-binding protein